MSTENSKRTMIALMSLSVALLLLFLSQWIYAEYNREREALRKDLEQVLVNVRSDLTESSIFKQLIIPALKEKDLNMGMRIRVDPGSQTAIDLQKRADGKKLVSFEAQRSIVSGETAFVQVSQLRTINGKNQLRDKMILRDSLLWEDSLPNELVNLTKGIKMLIRHIDSDATGPVILDTGILKANYDKELRRKGFDFTTSWTSNTGQKELKVPAVFPEYKSALMIGGYKKHLFLQLLPEAFFAVLLLSVISAAFFVMYRSFRTQQKLGIMKNDLVSNMTHELKTPIATVKVALEALNSFGIINDPRTSKEYLGMAVAEMDRLELLVSQALNTSLLESGTMQLSMERQDITPVIRQTIAAMQPKLEQNGALLELSLQDGPVAGDIDRLHFQGVIVNLVDNSLKYADKQPVIRIALQQEEQWIRIIVSDNGPGIPDRYIDKVFDKFFRVPSGNVHNVSGYGLGLSYSKKTVEQHGGSLGVRNNEEGGCSFIILLRKP